MLPDFSGCKILVIGELALDRYVSGSVERISPEAPVPVLLSRSERDVPGCAANVAANIAALGAKAILIGVTGTDPASKQLKSAIETFGNVELIQVEDRTRPTILKIRYVAGSHQLLRADYEIVSSIGNVTEAELTKAYIKAIPQCGAVVASDYAKGVLTDNILSVVIDEARRLGKPVVIDPKRKDFSAYRGATVIKPNRSELLAATGIKCEDNDGAAAAAAHVIRTTNAAVLFTRSEKGMSLFEVGQEPAHQVTTAIDVFDVSGAGDTVAAILGLSLAAGKSLADAMTYANAAAGLVVAKSGTATVTTAEVNTALSHSNRGEGSRFFDTQSLIRQVRAWRSIGLKVGFTNGCFDLVHPGHIRMLEKARGACDRLVVGLNSDLSVKRLKGAHRPIQDEDSRAFVLAHVKYVDGVILFDEDTPLNLITALRPDVLVKGADYKVEEVVGADVVIAGGGRVVLVDLVPDQSTTKLVNQSRVQA